MNKHFTLKFRSPLTFLLIASIVISLTTSSAFATSSLNMIQSCGEAPCTSTDSMALATLLGSPEQDINNDFSTTYGYSCSILNTEQALVNFDFIISNGITSLPIKTSGYGDLIELDDGRTFIAGKLRGEVSCASGYYRIIVAFQKIIDESNIFAGVTITPVYANSTFGSIFFLNIGHPILSYSDIAVDSTELATVNSLTSSSALPLASSPASGAFRTLVNNKSTSMSFNGTSKAVNTVSVSLDKTAGNIVLVDVSSNTTAFFRYVDNYLTTVVDSVSIQVGGATTDNFALVSGFFNLPDDFVFTTGTGEKTVRYSSILDCFWNILLWKFDLPDLSSLAGVVKELYESTSGSIKVELQASNKYGRYTYSSNFSRYFQSTWAQFDSEPLSVSFRLAGATAGTHQYTVTSNITYLVLANDTSEYIYYYVDAPTNSSTFSVSVPKLP